MQDEGLDTIEAKPTVRALRRICETIGWLSIFLRFLGITSLRLMTNNPEKIDAVLSSGIEVAERLSAEVPSSPYSEHYLATKRLKLGHFSDLTAPGDAVELDDHLVEGSLIR